MKFQSPSEHHDDGRKNVLPRPVSSVTKQGKISFQIFFHKVKQKFLKITVIKSTNAKVTLASRQKVLRLINPDF